LTNPEISLIIYLNKPDKPYGSSRPETGYEKIKNKQFKEETISIPVLNGVE
jgi:hypothetical protein